MTNHARRRLRVAATLVAVASACMLVALLVAQTPYVDPKLRDLISFARADIDTFWRGQIRGYVPPADVIMVQAPADTECGRFERPNAAYVWPVNKICWDVQLFTENFAIGDFAPVFILAHEWGHLAQRLLGFLSSARGLLTVQQELQADCLAGTYAADAKKRGILDPGDDDEAVISLRRHGDKLDRPWFASGSHGSPGQRVDSFLYGFEGRDCTADAFFAFLKEKGIDPSRVQQTPAPDTGALANIIQKQVGRFALVSTQRIQVVTATDAISADYKSADGIQVAHGVSAFASAELAAKRFDGAVAGAKAKGYTEVKRQDVVNEKNEKLGILVLLHGQTEVVFWTNKHLLSVVDAPRDVAWEFYNKVPY